LVSRGTLGYDFAMDSDGSDRKTQLRRFEVEAEMLALHQLDLIAQLELQLGAVHHTMRHIEKLRSRRSRAGSELTNGERGNELDRLASEIHALERQVETQRLSCQNMQHTIETMQKRLEGMRPSPRPDPAGPLLTQQPTDGPG
jgi:hypothetical protein